MISHDRAFELISARMDAPLTPAEHHELQVHLATETPNFKNFVQSVTKEADKGQPCPATLPKCTNHWAELTDAQKTYYHRLLEEYVPGNRAVVRDVHRGAGPYLDANRYAQILIVLQNQSIRGGVESETSGAKAEKANHYHHTDNDCLRMSQDDPVEKKSYWVKFSHSTPLVLVIRKVPKVTALLSF